MPSPTETAEAGAYEVTEAGALYLATHEIGDATDDGGEP